MVSEKVAAVAVVGLVSSSPFPVSVPLYHHYHLLQPSLPRVRATQV